jgi:hypothetical protein
MSGIDMLGILTVGYTCSEDSLSIDQGSQSGAWA